MPNKRGCIYVSNGATVYAGTYIKYDGYNGSITITSADGDFIIWRINSGVHSIHRGGDQIIPKDTYRSDITVPGGSTITRTLTVGNDTGYRMRSINLYCSDNYIVPHLVSWERSADSTSYAINVALHNLYKDSRTASKYGAITLHIKE